MGSRTALCRAVSIYTSAFSRTDGEALDNRAGAFAAQFTGVGG